MLKEKEQRKIVLRQYTKKLLYEFLMIQESMTEKEYREFIRLCRKHNFNKESFPGLFQVNVDSSDLIKTPRYLWQLWIYDNFIYHKKITREKIWIPSIVDEFKKNIGIMFRLNPKQEDKHYSFAIYSYFDLLSEIGIVNKISHRNNKLNLIICDEIPTYSNHMKNTMLTIALEDEASIFGIDVIKENYGNFLYDIRNLTLERNQLISKDITFNNQIKKMIQDISENVSESTLITEWDKNFIMKMVQLSYKDVHFSEKQVGTIKKITAKIHGKIQKS